MTVDPSIEASDACSEEVTPMMAAGVLTSDSSPHEPDVVFEPLVEPPLMSGNQVMPCTF